jgi:hypothetical protein
MRRRESKNRRTVTSEGGPKHKGNAKPEPEAKADEPKPEAKRKPQPDVTPQIVKRVHKLYEPLGRDKVQTV